jgi:anti-sigma factor RsiW
MKLDCTGVVTLLPAFDDGELPAPMRDAVAAHLSACDACRERQRREAAFTAFLRQRLPNDAVAPVAVVDAVRARLGSRLLPPRWALALASPWAPRLAAAAVLVLLVAAPFVWMPRHRAGQAHAHAAAEHHRTHGFVPGAPLPPCCKDLGVGVGAPLGPPSPGVVVPDLSAAGLTLGAATYCTFARPVNLLSYRDPAGVSFSLYMTDGALREFKLLRARARDGVVQARDEVTTENGRFAVCAWMRDGIVHTWVAPAGNATGDAALSLLLQAGH